MIKGATRPGTVEKLKREAKAAGVTWIKKIDGSSSQYRFACTHEETLFTSSIRDKKRGFKACSACSKLNLEQRYVAEAKTVNLVWIIKINKDWSIYEFPCGHRGTVQMHGMQKKKNPYEHCEVCRVKELEAKYRSEAKRFDIELLVPHETIKKNWYCRPNSCGHRINRPIRHIIQGTIDCEKCKLEKFLKEGAEKGLEPRYQVSGSSNTWLWEFIKCGHTMRATTTNVRHSQPKCQECLKIKHSNQALDSGLVLLGPAIRSDLDANFRSYRIIECGHEKDLAISASKDGSYTCNICLKTKWQEAAKKIGLTYVGEASGHGRSIYNFDKCGHKRELLKSHVSLEKIINCNTCEENSWSQPSYIYLIKLSLQGVPTWLKLGYAGHVEQRIGQYGLADNIKYEILKQSATSSRTVAHEIERQMIQVYGKQRLNLEDMRKYMSISGFSECYPEKLESEMIMTIDNMVRSYVTSSLRLI